MTYPLHTAATAPEAARPILEGTRKAFGFVPNLLATMANAPALLEGYIALGRLFDQSSLNATQRQVVLLAVSRENTCEYCVAAHTAIAGMQKVPATVVAAIRDGRDIADPALEALRRFTVTVVRSRGNPTEAEVAAFLAAGHTAQQVLEVVLGVGMKTLSNYTNHIAATPLDAAFAPVAWAKAA